MIPRHQARREPTTLDRAGRLLAYATAFGVAWIAFHAIALAEPVPVVLGAVLMFTAAGLLKGARR